MFGISITKTMLAFGLCVAGSAATAGQVYSTVARKPTVQGATFASASNSGTYTCLIGSCSGQFSNKTYGDLTTGKLGSASFGTDYGANSYASAISQWEEDITFTINGAASRNIDFSFRMTGQPIPPDPFGVSGFNHAGFNFFIFGSDSAGGTVGQLGASGIIWNATTVGRPFQGGSCRGGLPASPTLQDCAASPLGSLHSLDQNGLTGTLIARSDYRYRIVANVYTNGTADYYNTGTFRFGSLGNATMQSSSGVFLSRAGEVPEPDAWLLLIAGFGMIGAVARGRKPKTVSA